MSDFAKRAELGDIDTVINNANTSLTELELQKATEADRFNQSLINTSIHVLIDQQKVVITDKFNFDITDKVNELSDKQTIIDSIDNNIESKPDYTFNGSIERKLGLSEPRQCILPFGKHICIVRVGNNTIQCLVVNTDSEQYLNYYEIPDEEDMLSLDGGVLTSRYMFDVVGFNTTPLSEYIVKPTIVKYVVYDDELEVYRVHTGSTINELVEDFYIPVETYIDADGNIHVYDTINYHLKGVDGVETATAIAYMNYRTENVHIKEFLKPFKEYKRFDYTYKNGIVSLWGGI